MPANITIEQTPAGWRIEAVAPFTGSTFTADLNLCDCDGKNVKVAQPCAPHLGHGVDCKPTPSRCRRPLISGGYHRAHVEHFLRRLASTYEGKTEIPEVPFDASKVAA